MVSPSQSMIAIGTSLTRNGRRTRRLDSILLALWLIVPSLWSAGLGVARHEPQLPKPGESVRIRVNFRGDNVPEVAPVLEYQEVAPGSYISRDDPKYLQPWSELPLTRVSEKEFATSLPGDLQKNRHLIRYRVRATRGGPVLLPPAGDETGNYAYFVYAGVPDWRGAVDPHGVGPASQVVTYGTEVLTRVPVYHVIATRAAVEKVTWEETEGFREEESRHKYNYTCTVVYDGKVYDHVKFRARGGEWRHAMGKNMWKFNFNPGNRFAAKDFYGRPYKSKWDKLNLGACIQQGDTGMRGEHGLLEAVTYRLFNLAGVEAPLTHWVHLRIVTDAEETPKDQYRGDFWGMYLATEEVDGDFLKEHALPDGNLYKIQYHEPKTAHLAEGAPEDQADIAAFLARVRSTVRTVPPSNVAVDPWQWWQQRVDLQRYYSYRAILECAHHYDVHSGKNYYFYHDIEADRWQVIPWDVDLSWGLQMYGTGQEPFYLTGLLFRPPFREAYQQRLAEIRDLLFNEDQTGRLIDEHVAMIWDPKGGPSFTDADRAKWDYHPIMSSTNIHRVKTRPGLFYFGNPNHRFDVMPRVMKEFIAARQDHLDSLLMGYTPPASPDLSGPDSVSIVGGTFSVRPIMPPALAPVRIGWRMAEVTDATCSTSEPHTPWRYEIETCWETETSGDSLVTVPTNSLVPGHSYRLRVRAQTADGRWSRWSKAQQFQAH